MASDLPDGLMLESRQGIGWLTVHRPSRANALTLDLQAGVAAFLRAADHDDSTVAVVIGASGKVFSAGGDLRELAEVDARDLARRRRDVFLDLLEAMLAFGKPLVTAVNGPAIGAGAMIGLLGDQVVACEDARFELPEVAIATPAFLATVIAAHVGGGVFARDMLLAGKSISASLAARRGCISECVLGADLSERAQELALALSRMPADAYRETKRWLNAQLLASVRAACAESARVRAEQAIATPRR